MRKGGKQLKRDLKLTEAVYANAMHELAANPSEDPTVLCSPVVTVVLNCSLACSLANCTTVHSSQERGWGGGLLKER